MNAIFIHVPKTGGRSLVTDLGFTTILDNFVKSKIKGKISFGHVYIGSLIKKDLISMDYFNNSFKFSIVRNPYDRCVSLFFYIKYVSAHKKIIREDLKKYMSEFRLFCGGLNKIRPIGLFNVVGNSQANTQTSWLTYNKKMFCNYVGRFENYCESVKKIASELKMKIPDQLSNICESKVHKEFNYRDFYDPQTLKLVSSYYSVDFDNFGYDKNKL